MQIKKWIIASAIALVFAGCDNAKEESIQQEAVMIKSGKVSPVISVGEMLEPFTLSDQFEKKHTLSKETKNLVFAFSKQSGHVLREYFKTKSKGFISNNAIFMVADVSKMPSLIRDFIAIPDFKESHYPILLLQSEIRSKQYQNESHIEQIMLVKLDNLKVTSVHFLSSAEQLESFFD